MTDATTPEQPRPGWWDRNRSAILGAILVAGLMIGMALTEAPL